ncbi:MAG: Ig-like domain-containing protein [Gemmatimonadaceae bacterium]
MFRYLARAAVALGSATLAFAAPTQAQRALAFAGHVGAFQNDTVVLAAPIFGTYAGTSVPLSAQLWLRGDVQPRGDAPITWQSSNVSVAWVAENGTLTMLAPGKVTITAHSGALATSRTIVVQENPAIELALAMWPGAEVLAGDTVRFAARVVGKDGRPVADARVTYALSVRGASQPSSAWLNEDGDFVSDAPGLYTVIATVGGVADRATVVVKPRQPRARGAMEGAVRRIEIGNASYRPYIGTALALQADVWEQGGKSARADAPVLWTSSDPRVALVDPAGNIYFNGTGKVTVAAEYGGKRAERTFDVQRQPAAHVALTINSGDVRTGDAVKLRDEVWQRGGARVRDARVNYAVVGHRADGSTIKATISDDRVFTPQEPGVYTIIAEIGGLAQQTTLVVRPRSPVVGVSAK